MGRDHVCRLIGVTYREDTLKQKLPVEHPREVFCQVEGLRQSEFFGAGRQCLKAQFMVTVFPDDYAGESLIEVDGVRYGICRTYPAKHDKLELYLEKKGGV